MTYYAHILNHEKRQTVFDHLEKVAKMTQKTLAPLGLGKIGYLVGILHDLGKLSEIFQEYLLRAAIDKEKTVRGSVIHSTCGLAYLFSYKTEDPYRNALIELCGFVIASHHGLMDCVDAENNNVFQIKIKQQDTDQYTEAVRVFEDRYSKSEIENLINESVTEFQNKYKELKLTSYRSGLLARTILSGLVDADYSDTSSFMNEKTSEDFSYEETRHIFERMQRHTEGVIKKLEEESEHNQINEVRRQISLACKEKGNMEGGIYRLSVPTGAGKTLASFRYSLQHALKWQKNRIFYIAPLLTILDQNARELSDTVGEENKKYILEHSSDVEKTEMSKDDLSAYVQLAQTWDSPLIITTLVQFLNTLFAKRGSNIRRLQSLINSIIIIDEVQTVPLKMTNMFNDAINYLSEALGCTILLCSATQPSCMERIVNREEKKYRSINDKGDLIALTDEQKSVFNRTRMIDKRVNGGYSGQEIADFILQLMEEKQSVMLVCNTKQEAIGVYRLLADVQNDFMLFHLSAGMCKAHRKEVLEKVNSALRENRKTVLIATQVVEAGVNISFESVIRVLAGADSLSQAAGRCNRHGEFHKRCDVYVIEFKGENLKALKEIEISQKATLGAMFYDADILSERGIKKYYTQLYQCANECGKNLLNYPVKDLPSLYTLLSTGLCHVPNSEFMRQAFKTAGERFKVFDENTHSVIVRYKDSASLIAELYTQRAMNDYEYVKSIIEKLKAYTVSIYDYQKQKLEDNQGLEEKDFFGHVLYFLEEDFYGETGLSEENIRITEGGY
ncbi:MAG: CRISPR-associated helicase Cas3' [Clostridia bacterium]|nr:CRISPR-associated helicase Cas3' [Clostridia bacterium]